RIFDDLDHVRLCGRQRGDDAPSPAARQSHGPRRISRHRRQRGHALRAAGDGPSARRAVAGGARRRRGRDHRAHHHGSGGPLALSPLARGHGPLMSDGGTILSPRELRLEIEEFNSAYAAALDAAKIEEWPRFFTDDAVYRITGRENADAGLAVGLVYCEGIGMLRVRALVIAENTLVGPRYLLH